MRVNRYVILAFALFFGTTLLVACSGRNVEDDIRSYISSNTSHSIYDLRVVESEPGRFTVVATLERGTDVELFAPFTEQMILLSEAAAADNDVEILNVNTIILLDGDRIIGWASREDVFYTRSLRVLGVTIDMLSEELAFYMGTSYNEINLLLDEVAEYIVATLSLRADYVQVSRRLGGTISINISVGDFYSLNTFPAMCAKAIDVVSELAEFHGFESISLVVRVDDVADIGGELARWYTTDLISGVLTDNSPALGQFVTRFNYTPADILLYFRNETVWGDFVDFYELP